MNTPPPPPPPSTFAEIQSVDRPFQREENIPLDNRAKPDSVELLPRSFEEETCVADFTCFIHLKRKICRTGSVLLLESLLLFPTWSQISTFLVLPTTFRPDLIQFHDVMEGEEGLSYDAMGRGGGVRALSCDDAVEGRTPIP